MGGVRGPIDQGDALLGERTGDLMVFDDDEAASDAGALAEEPVGVFLVVEDIGDDDDVVRVVGVGEGVGVVCADGDGLASSCEALEPGDLDAFGAVGVVHDGAPEGADAAPDVEDGIARLEVWEDGADEDALAGFVDGGVEGAHERADEAGFVCVVVLGGHGWR